MTTRNLFEYKKLNALFKRRLKEERTKAWIQWAESLNPRSSAKDIFRKFKKLSNYRTPNQFNMMFQNPGMVGDFLNKLCKPNAPSKVTQIRASNTEDPFSMEELDYVLARKKDSAPGMDGMKYGDLINFPERIKCKFLQLVNDIWSEQNVPELLKRILMVLIPKPGRDLKLLNSHRPIALLSVYLKVINAMIKVRLEKIINDKGLLDDHSYGFVKHRSSIDCVNHIFSIIQEKRNGGYQVMGIFLDIEDAFSNVNLSKLQSIMNRMGRAYLYNTRIG